MVRGRSPLRVYKYWIKSYSPLEKILHTPLIQTRAIDELIIILCDNRGGGGGVQNIVVGRASGSDIILCTRTDGRYGGRGSGATRHRVRRRGCVEARDMRNYVARFLHRLPHFFFSSKRRRRCRRLRLDILLYINFYDVCASLYGEKNKNKSIFSLYK